MSSPYDRLADDYPHGTIEGERRGCLGADCPAKPLTCFEVRGRYRSNIRFKRAYDRGLRGAELLEASTVQQVLTPRDEEESSTPEQPRPAAATVPVPVGAHPETDVPVHEGMTERESFATLPKVKQTEIMARLYEHGWRQHEIATRLGVAKATVSYRLRVHRSRPVTVEFEGEKYSALTDAPYPLDTDDEADDTEFRAPQWERESAQTRGARVAKLWVLLDAEDNLVMASTSETRALEALAGLATS